MVIDGQVLSMETSIYHGIENCYRYLLSKKARLPLKTEEGSTVVASIESWQIKLELK